MSAYIVLTREKTIDADELKTYAAKAPAAAQVHPIERLAFYGELQVLEGPDFEGAVILGFPSAAEARAWYESDAYQEALKHRKAGADYRVFLIEGASKA